MIRNCIGIMFVFISLSLSAKESNEPDNLQILDDCHHDCNFNAKSGYFQREAIKQVSCGDTEKYVELWRAIYGNERKSSLAIYTVLVRDLYKNKVDVVDYIDFYDVTNFKQVENMHLKDINNDGNDEIVIEIANTHKDNWEWKTLYRLYSVCGNWPNIKNDNAQVLKFVTENGKDITSRPQVFSIYETKNNWLIFIETEADHGIYQLPKNGHGEYIKITLEEFYILRGKKSEYIQVYESPR